MAYARPQPAPPQHDAPHPTDSDNASDPQPLPTTLPQPHDHSPPTLTPIRQRVGYGPSRPAGAPLVPPTRHNPLQDSMPLSLAPLHPPHKRPTSSPPTSPHHHLPARFTASALTPASTTPPTHASTTTRLRGPAPQILNPPLPTKSQPTPKLHDHPDHPHLHRYPHSRKNSPIQSRPPPTRRRPVFTRRLTPAPPLTPRPPKIIIYPPFHPANPDTTSARAPQPKSTTPTNDHTPGIRQHVGPGRSTTALPLYHLPTAAPLSFPHPVPTPPRPPPKYPPLHPAYADRRPILTPNPAIPAHTEIKVTAAHPITAATRLGHTSSPLSPRASTVPPPRNPFLPQPVNVGKHPNLTSTPDMITSTITLNPTGTTPPRPERHLPDAANDHPPAPSGALLPPSPPHTPLPPRCSRHYVGPRTPAHPHPFTKDHTPGNRHNVGPGRSTTALPLCPL